MAVQKNRKSSSKRDMRRSHDRLSGNAITVDATTGEAHLRHHIGPSGSYRGRQVVEVEETE